MSENNGWVNNFGRILEARETKNKYIEITKDVVLKKGDRILLKKHAAHLDGLVKAGKITSEEAEQKLEKQGFVKYLLSRTPRENLSE